MEWPRNRKVIDAAVDSPKLAAPSGPRGGVWHTHELLGNLALPFQKRALVPRLGTVEAVLTMARSRVHTATALLQAVAQLLQHGGLRRQDRLVISDDEFFNRVSKVVSMKNGRTRLAKSIDATPRLIFLFLVQQRVQEENMGCDG